MLATDDALPPPSTAVHCRHRYSRRTAVPTTITSLPLLSAQPISAKDGFVSKGG
jgi:hypothetical protein